MNEFTTIPTREHYATSPHLAVTLLLFYLCIFSYSFHLGEEKTSLRHGSLLPIISPLFPNLKNYCSSDEYLRETRNILETFFC